jgi:hypothetical protein
VCRSRYLVLGQAVAKQAVSDFWPEQGWGLGEKTVSWPRDDEAELTDGFLNLDQFSFKGIFLHYLTR